MHHLLLFAPFLLASHYFHFRISCLPTLKNTETMTTMRLVLSWLITFLVLIPTNAYGRYECQKDCSDEALSKYMSNCCCLSCDNGRMDYSKYPSFACCSYREKITASWYVFYFVGLGSLLAFYQSIFFWFRGYGNIPTARELLSCAERNKAIIPENTEIRSQEQAVTVKALSSHVQSGSDGFLAAEYVAEVEMSGETRRIGLTKYGYRDLIHYQRINPTIPVFPEEDRQLDQGKTYRYPGFSVILDKSHQALYLYRSAGYHARMVESAIFGGIMGLACNLGVFCVSKFSVEKITLFVVNILLCLVGLCLSRGINSEFMCILCAKDKKSMADEDDECSYLRIYQYKQQPVRGTDSSQYVQMRTY